MTEKRLLIPKIFAPTHKLPGGAEATLQILWKNKRPFAQSKSEACNGGTNLLQMEIPCTEDISQSPIILELENPKTGKIKVTILQRAESTTLWLDPENPTNTHKIQGNPKLLTEEGFLCAVGANSTLLSKNLSLCNQETKDNDRNPQEIIQKIEELFQECQARKISWKKIKEEISTSPNIDPWPEGYLTHWLKLLDRTRILQASTQDIDWIETQEHKWIFIPEADENQPGTQKEQYLSANLSEENSLELRKLVLLTAIINRPEEAADFACQHKMFQTQTHMKKNPIQEFFSLWTQNIPQMRGTLIPNLLGEA